MASNHVLRAAAQAGDLGKVEARLASGDDLEGRHRGTGRTPLLEAVIAGHIDVTRRLLDGGADLEAACTAVGHTALGWAVAQGHAEIARLLIDRGAVVDGVDAKSFLDRTPLHLASQNGAVTIIRLLVDAGASLERVDSRGDNALSLARDGGHDDAAALLAAAGARGPQRRDAPSPIPWPELDWDPCMLDHDDALPDDVEPAGVVFSYICAIHNWQQRAWPALKAAEAAGTTFDLTGALAEADRLTSLHVTGKPRVYRRAALGAISDLTPEFALIEESVPSAARRELLIRHPDPSEFMHEYEWEFVCLRRGGRWRIDSARNRLLGTKTWERAIL